MSVRSRIIVGFIIATLAPLAVIVAISISELKLSLSLASTRDLDDISQTLQKTGRELYQRSCDLLKRDAARGKLTPIRYSTARSGNWPADVEEFADADDPERFTLAGDEGSRLDYLVRHGEEIWVYTMPFDGVQLGLVAKQYSHARDVVAHAKGRNLRRGYIYTLIVLALVVWGLATVGVVLWAQRLSRPIRQLTKGLGQVAAGNLDERVEVRRLDEIGTAIDTFNRMTAELRHSRDRLVYMARLESWQALARKMAHEVKNSLTPIRLTMEEVAARDDGRDSFLQTASQIVVDEVTSLERRVRAFADFSSEPPIRPRQLDVNSLLQERISFLKTAHPEIAYSMRLADDQPCAVADEDLVKGMLTNLLENAAQATKPGGVVLGITDSGSNGKVAIEVHDSGPGLAPQVRNSLFQPTISFKPGGMGLGLSIARRSAVLSGGDIELVTSELGGAGFRVLLPKA